MTHENEPGSSRPSRSDHRERTELHRIVVGTSLTEASDSVLRSALELRRRTGVSLLLVHGFPMPVVYGGGIYGSAAIHVQLERDQKLYRSRLREQLERIGASEEDFGGIVVELESGHRLLDQVAERENADLILIGAHEGPELGPLSGFLGSTADRILRRTTRPVLVVRGELGELANVLAPVDLSKLSEACLARGLVLLEALLPEGAEPAAVAGLFVLSSLDREGSPHFEPEQVDRFASEELQAFLERASPHGEGRIRPVLRNGRATQEILAYLEAHPADLVVLGTHGRSGMERFLLGSVASEVLRRIGCHTLVIPPRNEDGGDEDTA